MSTRRSISLVVLSIFLVAFSAGCKKPPPPPPPPPPPKPAEPAPPPQPEVTLSAEPSSIERGGSATLKWSSKNATGATLNQGIGTVPTSGSREVFPTQSTSYEIIVKGEGGEAMASARVAVRVPPPPPPKPEPPDISKVLRQNVKDAYFDYDQSSIRADAETTLRGNASALKKILQDYPNARVVLEGHCDDRGTNEYNLALGDRRSTAARDFIVSLGVSAGRLTTISYGEERQQCSESHEGCWQKNRRVHFAVAP